MKADFEKAFSDFLDRKGKSMMKKAGLFVMTLSLLMCLTACGAQDLEAPVTRSHEHLALVSSIEKEDCLLCSDAPDHEIGFYLGQDNIGLVNMNTFEVLPVEVNRYEAGRLLEEATGVMQTRGGTLGDTSAWVLTDVDRGYAHIQIGPCGEGVDPVSVAAFLCQDCLDAFAERFFVDDKLSSIGVINFSSREVQPLVDTRPFFGIDNFLIDCDFKEDSGMDLLVTYSPVRY